VVSPVRALHMGASASARAGGASEVPVAAGMGRLNPATAGTAPSGPLADESPVPGRRFAQGVRCRPGSGEGACCGVRAMG
jgi:hypothetical protein